MKQKSEQRKRFEEMARKLECDPKEDNFNKKLKKIAKHKSNSEKSCQK
jgi:hypothetical protein